MPEENGENIGETAKEHMAKATELLQSIAGPLINFVFDAIPIIINNTRKAYKIYLQLPLEYVHFFIGFVMCFFGGIYPSVFAALQAAEHGGLATVKKSLIEISQEVMIIVEENKKDNETDADKDGKSDVQQISARELVRRKTKLVLTKMNPEKVNKAISSIYKVWMSVLAVLTIQFARTIALAMSISDFTRKIVNRFVTPIVRDATPPEYQKWIPIIMDWFCKSIGMSIAWRIQTVISAFTSALTGGLIMSRAMLIILVENEIDLGDKINLKDHTDTTIDEIASYIFAGLGFSFQYNMSFSAPFPLNILLYPVQMMEYYIRWSVTK